MITSLCFLFFLLRFGRSQVSFSPMQFHSPSQPISMCFRMTNPSNPVGSFFLSVFFTHALCTFSSFWLAVNDVSCILIGASWVAENPCLKPSLNPFPSCTFLASPLPESATNTRRLAYPTCSSYSTCFFIDKSKFLNGQKFLQAR